jgi:peroxiredoxin Q/BCP
MTIEIGDRAPAFTLLDDRGEKVSLGDLTASGRGLVLYFYPKAFTPGCTTEACDFRDSHERFAAAGYEIAGVSPDSPATLARFRDEYHLPFRLLSDPDHAVAASYGAWGTKTNYGREYEGLIRSTFVIGADGTVEQVFANVKAKGHAERVGADLA